MNTVRGLAIASLALSLIAFGLRVIDGRAWLVASGICMLASYVLLFVVMFKNRTAGVVPRPQGTERAIALIPIAGLVVSLILLIRELFTNDGLAISQGYSQFALVSALLFGQFRSGKLRGGSQ